MVQGSQGLLVGGDELLVAAEAMCGAGGAKAAVPEVDQGADVQGGQHPGRLDPGSEGGDLGVRPRLGERHVHVPASGGGLVDDGDAAGVGEPADEALAVL